MGEYVWHIQSVVLTIVCILFRELSMSKGLSQNWLEHRKIINYNDSYILSGSKFSCGGIYGLEIPVINSLSIVEKTIEECKKQGVKCSRFNETRGAGFIPESELKEMLIACQEHNIGLVLSLSPRPEYDTQSTFYRSPFGLEQCRKLNNMNAIRWSIDEAIRLAELGCRGLIVYDLGVLHLLNEMRKDGLLPQDLCFKASSHCMVTNPYIAKIYFNTGSDSITMMHDCSIEILSETRRINNEKVLDIPIDTYKDKGGFLRYHEIADIVRYSSPVFLKVGASAQSNPYDDVNNFIISKRVKSAVVCQEYLYRELPNAKIVSPNNPICCLPKILPQKTKHKNEDLLSSSV